MEFQTRSEESGLKFFKTLREAVEEAEKDKTIWKISFRVGKESIRLVRVHTSPPDWAITFMEQILDEAEKEIKERQLKRPIDTLSQEKDKVTEREWQKTH